CLSHLGQCSALHKLLMDCRGGELAILNSHDGGGRAGKANAIPDRIHSRQAGLKAGIHSDEALLDFQAQQRSERRLVLTDGLDDLVRRELELRTRDGLRGWTA